MKKQSCILLIAVILLLGRSSGLAYNGIPWYDDPCYTNIVTTTCSGASLSLTNIQTSSPVCLGDSISASVITITNFGTNTAISKWIAASTNCPDSTNTSLVSPNVLSNWWVVAGPGSFSANGDGLSASFTPTNRGTGTITFNEAYQNGCDTNTQTTSASGSFTVNHFKIDFNDFPHGATRPWSVDFQLDAVCQTNWGSNYNSIATIYWGFNVDAAGHSTVHSSGAGNVGECNTIVITSFTNVDNYFEPAFGLTTSGAKIKAYFIGCCNSGSLNWVQKVISESPPNPSLPDPPRFDVDPTVSPYYYFGPPGSGSGTNDTIGAHTSDYNGGCQ